MAVAQLNLVRFATISAAAMALLLSFYYELSDGVLDISGHVLGRDFLNFYTGGELLASGEWQTLFDGLAYMDVIGESYGDNYPSHNWSYPPSIFIFSRIAVTMPYMLALALWYTCGVISIAFAVRALKLDMIWVALVVFSPAGMLNILAGQNGYFTASLITLAIVYAAQKPKIISATSWAMLTIKPHLGLVALPMLVAQRNFYIIIMGGVCLIPLIGVSIVMWGVEPWYLFFDYTVAQQRLVIENWRGFIYVLVPTGFMQGRMLSFDTGIVYFFHAVYAITAAFLSVRAWPGRKADHRLWLAWFVVSTFIMLPYSFLYDLVVFQVVLALYAAQPEKLFYISKKWSQWLWMLGWLLPILTIPIVFVLKLQVLPLFLLFTLWRLGVAKRSETALQLDAGTASE
ncbi:MULTISPECIES: glycosyltransferase family 87 protein [Rhodobacterales]|uniref:glycosyltransferase family 87 protein n=1 Tax=Rhodobacterales TaxID=204455 RepID=UPI0015F007C2|nr:MULTISPECIES: glycosyltransferase family 87 protein [Rhodobacterales]MDO6591268.1 glycosyltransferase family 87 protein [Yoonia sp. 1_MG-2023]